MGGPARTWCDGLGAQPRVVFGTDKLVALAALVALQAYLMLSPSVA
ncbi:MAG: hypothetical protein R2705_00600 [Ilumatobacteraceae bacterium]